MMMTTNQSKYRERNFIYHAKCKIYIELYCGVNKITFEMKLLKAKTEKKYIKNWCVSFLETGSYLAHVICPFSLIVFKSFVYVINKCGYSNDYSIEMSLQIK